MSHTYVIVDFHNLIMRSRHGMRAPDAHGAIGLALHLTLSSIRKVWSDFNADHCVFGFEGRSWRRDAYEPYKANRRVTAAARTPQQVQEDQEFFQAIGTLQDYLINRTNCTVLRHAQAEADDMIARWIALHPQDQHIIISTDSDFQQLLAPNVRIYNGMTNQLFALDGITENGKPCVDKKGQPLSLPEPAWLLFEKIVRGDSSDNIMSAYPGVRKTKLREAYEDRETQGFAWNNLMLSRWCDHNDQEITVRDAYVRNQALIDLTKQPPEFQQQFDAAIVEAVNRTPRSQIGFHFLRFTAQWELKRIESRASEYTTCFSSAYEGHLLQA